MTWSEFRTGLVDVATTGRMSGSEEVRAAMLGLGMISGSEADAGGLVLTDRGRSWYQRTTIDRENERILESYGALFDRVLDLDKPRGLR